MKTKTMLWIIVALLCIGGSVALNTTKMNSVFLAYHFETNFSNNANYTNFLINQTGVSLSTAQFKQGVSSAYGTGASGALANASTSGLLTGNHAWALSFWFYPVSWVGNKYITLIGTTNGGQMKLFIQEYNSSKGYVMRYSTWDAVSDSSTAFNLSKWYHIFAVYHQNKTTEIYINGTLDKVTTWTGTINYANNRIEILSDTAFPANAVNGYIDAYYYWQGNNSIPHTTAEAQEWATTLFSNYTGYFYPFTSTKTYTYIQMLNVYNNETILNFSVTACQGTTCETTNTTTGTATFLDYNGNYNFSVTIPNYYENTKNFSATISGTTIIINTSIQSIFNVTLNEVVSNLSINNFNASIPSYSNTTTGYNLFLITDNQPKNITISKAGYLPTTILSQATSGQITPITTTIGTLNLSINSINGVGNAVNGYNVTISSNNYTYTTTQTTTTNILNLILIKGNYTLTFEALNYSTNYLNLSLTTNYNHTNIFFQENSFFLVFRDEITKNIINNISLYLISDVFANNYTTYTGTLDITLLTPSDYTFRYEGIDASLYPKREYYQTLFTKQYYNLTFYLIQNSSSSLINTIVYNQNNNLLQGANVKVLRYDITTNSYNIVAEKLTDSNGQSLFYLQPYGEYYKFIIEYGGVQYFESTPSQINTNTYIFTIILTEIFGTSDYNAYITTKTNFSVVNSSTFRFFWNDANNEITQGCLFIYVNNTKLINSACSTGTAGILYYTASSANNLTYKGDAFIYQGDKYNYIGTLWISFVSSLEDEIGEDILFWLFIVTLATTFVFIINATIAIILLPIPLLIFNFVNLINFNWFFVIGITISCWIIAYIIEDKQ